MTPNLPPLTPASRVSGVRLVGQRALRAELEHSEDVLALQEHLTRNPLPDQLEVISAAETVLITCANPHAADRIRKALLGLIFPSRQLLALLTSGNGTAGEASAQPDGKSHG